MGVASSDLSTPEKRSLMRRQPSLNDVPESCISSILMRFDPPEICKLAGLNRSFHAASTADFLWETKLPSNYNYLVTEVLGFDVGSSRDKASSSSSFPCKKDIYAMLCRPNRFDGGTKEVWLDKSSGKVCMLISAKAMKITGIDDRRYWNYIPTDESRFHVVAYLQQIWWFEVVGEIDFQFPPGSYSLLFRLHQGKASKRFGRRVCNVDQVHGWDIKPVRFQLWTSDGQRSSSEYSLSERAGIWVHCHVGDFVVDKENSATKITFCMMQIDCTHTKGGLCLDSVLICPTKFREGLK